MSSETESTDKIDWRSEASNIEMSRRERLAVWYSRNIRTPALVAWSDIRTRIGITIIFVYLAMAFVELLGLYREPSPNQAEAFIGLFEKMSAPLGTDGSGQDLLALIIESTPFILQMVVAGGIWATTLAIAVGTLSGYKGGTTDTVLMTISDFFMSIPGLPLVIVLAITISPENPWFLGIILTINYWAGLSRSIRSQVLSIREHSYVEASRTMGTSTPRIILKDVLPNIMPYVLVNFVLAARYTIFASVGLYFIGVLPFTGQNWGVTLNNAYNQGALYGLDVFYWLLVPMVTIIGIAFGLILISQGMDRIFNPRVRTRMSGESESTEEPNDETNTGMM